MPRTQKSFKLLDLALDRVDLCAAGANPDANIMLFKSASQEEEDDVPQPKKKTPATKAKAKGKADARSKSKQRGDEEEEEEEEDDAVAKTDDDEEEEDDDVTDEEEEEEEEEKPTRRTKKKSTPKGKAKKVAKVDDDDEGDVDDHDDIADDDDEDELEEVPESVLKTLPRAVREQVERSNRIAKRAAERAKEAHRMALTEKSRRERIEYIEKAKTDIPHLTGTADEKGELLQTLYSGQPLEKKQADRIVKMLKSGDAAVASLMTETGSNRGREDSDDSAYAQLKDKADEIRESNDKLTKEQAFTKACTDNPKLYNMYKSERRRSVDVM